jgi:hypothetical protein
MLKVPFIVLVGAASSLAHADESLSKYRNFTGFTGLINTVNAEVLDSGEFDFSFNNQLNFRGDEYLEGYNYIFSVGLYEGLEVSGLAASNTMHDNFFNPQVHEEHQQLRDLSFNLKYQVPYIPKDWFNLAVGFKDFGGASNKYESYFAVLSRDISDFRFSLGLSSGDSKMGLMDGPFAGVEWMPYQWFALQLEHDAEAVNAAARFTVPREWLYDLGELTFTSRFYSNTEFAEKDRFWGVNFTTTLSEQDKRSYQEIKPAPPIQSDVKNLQIRKQVVHKVSKQVKEAKLERKNVKSSSGNVANLAQQLRQLKRALANDGFENIRIGHNSNSEIIIYFENRVFNRNDIDALGVVMGRASEYINHPNARFLVTLEKSDIALLSIKGNVTNYRNFVDQGISPDLDIRQGSMPIPTGVVWIGNVAESSPYLLPRVTLSPALSSTYATELGVYDFSLALRADVEVPLWKGAGVNFTVQRVVADTEDFEPGDSFEGRREHNGLDQAVFYQAFELPFNIYNLTQIGSFKEYHDYYGIINETTWISSDGRHQVSANVGKFEYQDYDFTRDYYLGEYQFNWSEQDITLHASMGKFWGLDKGLRVESRFWFGDSYVAIYAAETVAQQVGIAFSIPLSPRKDMAVTKFGQIKGNEAWRHGVTTRIGESHNALVRNQAYKPYTRINLERTFLNQGRNSSSYVYANLARLREAYLTYK